MLLDLRDRQRLDWGDVARRMSLLHSRSISASQAQEQYGQLTRKSQGARHWTQADTNALRLAIENSGTVSFGVVSTQVSVHDDHPP